MNFLTLFIACLVLIAIAFLAIGIGMLTGRKNSIQHGSCRRNTANDGIVPGCGKGVEHCCTRQ